MKPSYSQATGSAIMLYVATCTCILLYISDCWSISGGSGRSFVVVNLTNQSLINFQESVYTQSSFYDCLATECSISGPQFISVNALSGYLV